VKLVEFVFLHSYSSVAPNWHDVVMGLNEQAGRLTRAMQLAHNIACPVIANDARDEENAALYESKAILNLGTACNTQDEVVSALAHSQFGRVLFVSSPDHLPRIVRDATAAGGTHAFFAASDVPFSDQGPSQVEIVEPAHRKCGY
jgi:hypothetical protein